MFDVDDDGLITTNFENVSIIDIGLTKQAYELMRSIDTDNNGVIDFKEFCNRFRIVFDRVRITSDEPLEGAQQTHMNNLALFC